MFTLINSTKPHATGYKHLNILIIFDGSSVKLYVKIRRSILMVVTGLGIIWSTGTYLIIVTETSSELSATHHNPPYDEFAELLMCCTTQRAIFLLIDESSVE